MAFKVWHFGNSSTDSDGKISIGDMKADVDGMPFKITVGDIKEEPAQVSYSAAVAEYLAMTLFVVIGCGSAMAICKEPGWVLQVALTFGLAISSLAYTVGHYS